MQNKPNLPNAQMNVTSVLTKDYENKRLCRCVKTNPIQSQYKANTNPIPEWPKMNVNSFITKDYENKPPSSPKKTNPIQTQSNPTCSELIEGPALHIFAAIMEQLLLGLVAYRVGKEIEYDGAKGRVTNSQEGNALLRRAYRPGWILNG